MFDYSHLTTAEFLELIEKTPSISEQENIARGEEMMRRHKVRMAEWKLQNA